MGERFTLLLHLLSIFLIPAVVIGSIIMYNQAYYEKQLVLFREDRLEEIGYGLGLIETTAPIETVLPRTFTVGNVKLSKTSIRHYNKRQHFFTIIEPEDFVMFSFTVTEPVNFKLSITERKPKWNIKNLQINLVYNETMIKTFTGEYKAENKVYITFHFNTKPQYKSKITLNGRLYTQNP